MKLRTVHAGFPLFRRGGPGPAMLVAVLSLYFVATGAWPLILRSSELFRGKEQPWDLVLANLGSRSTVAAISLMPLGALAFAPLVPAVGVDLSMATVALSNYRFIFFEQTTVFRAFRNSLFLSAVTALVSAMVAIPRAYVSVIRRNRIARFLDEASGIPNATPRVVLSIAMILSFIQPLPIVLTLVLAFAVGVVGRKLPDGVIPW